MISRLTMLLSTMLIAPLIVFIASPATPAAAATTDLLVGDSVMAGMSASARSSLPNHRFDAQVCRRVVSTSCSYQGNRPATALNVIRANAGATDRAIVVAAGYNDDTITSAIDQVMAEARRQGVPHVVWLTYRVAGRYPSQLRNHNATLWAKAAQYPDLTIADWASRSAGRGDWVARDGLHLNASGGRAMAQLIAEALGSLAPPPPTRCDLAAGGEAAPPISTAAQLGDPAGVTMHDAPRRLADTRNNTMIRAQHVLRVPVPAEYSDANAAVITLTAVDPCRRGNLATFACGAARPPTSTLNARDRGATANLAVAPIGEGAICIYASMPTDIVVDLLGHLDDDGVGLRPTEPARVFDTRTTTPTELVSANGRRQDGTVTTIPIRRADQVSDDATAVFVNVTATESTRRGYVTTYPGPCTSAPPTASNLNHVGGETIAVAAITKIGTDGTICVYNHAPTHLVVDVSGVAVADGALLQTVSNTRLADSRTAAGPGAGDFVVTTAGAAEGTVGALVNVVGIRDGRGYLTTRRCGNGTAPAHSTLNHRDGAVANLALAPIDGDRTCVYRQPAADVVVDAVAWLVAPS
ncbi:MAG: hypothetical protein AAGA42_00785 [Actinomycetota bacterium]